MSKQECITEGDFGKIELGCLNVGDGFLYQGEHHIVTQLDGIIVSCIKWNGEKWIFTKRYVNYFVTPAKEVTIKLSY